MTIARHTQERKQSTGGFTLIEMAVVIVIIGILATMFTPLVNLYFKNERREETQNNIAEVNNALSGFLALYGRYPCPAPTNGVLRNQDEYGHEDIDPATGTCVESVPTAEGNWGGPVGGTFVQESLRTDLATPPRVRVGMVPFRTLNLDEGDAYDGNGFRLTYAVTENLTVANTFNRAEGGITVRGGTGGILTEPDHSAHFIVISHGENAEGAFNKLGAQNACPGGDLESENCDLTDTPEYRVAERNTSNSANQIDDTIVYGTADNVPAWELEDTLYQHVNFKPSGDVGINLLPNMAPEDELHVLGTTRAIDDPETVEEEGRVFTENLCAYYASDDPMNANYRADCFPSSVIAGLIADGEGMQCPAGKFMTGIQNGAPICEEEVIISCPTGTIMTGLNGDGTLKCNTPPPPGCDAAPVNICGNDVMMSSASHGEWRYPQGSGNGGTQTKRYQCWNGTWVSKNWWPYPSGTCNCTPGYWYTKTNAYCGSGSWVNRYKVRVDRIRVCPSGSSYWDWANADRSECLCKALPLEYTDIGCPAGWTGDKYSSREYVCDTANAGHWIDYGITDNCTCDPTATQDDTEQCSVVKGPAYSGTIYKTRTMNCSTGTWDPWVKDDSQCGCTGYTLERTKDECAADEIGSFYYTQSYDCTTDTLGPEIYDRNDCQPKPVVSYSWEAPALGVTSASPQGPRAGTECTTPGVISNCHAPGGPWTNYSGCVCGG